MIKNISDKKLRIAIAGLGTVGCGVIKIINNNFSLLQQRTGYEFIVVAVSARDNQKDRGINLDAYEWFSDPVEMAKSDCFDVFVELIGGDNGVAHQAVEIALERGKNVVTANKALLALYGNYLARLAEDNGGKLYYEAAVAGGIPIIKTMRETLVASEISQVYGIMNGTCNYILTSMEKNGLEFAEALKKAQDLGYAEADPTFDIGGFDTAHKLAILTSLAFGCEIDFSTIYIEGIEKITADDIKGAAKFGYRIKLLGIAVATNEGIEQRVHPTMVPLSSPIADVDGAFNAVAVKGSHIGDLMLEGPGAGEGATATAVIADIADIARGGNILPLAMPGYELTRNRSTKAKSHGGAYYLRLSIYDKTGYLASITKLMADHSISVAQISQRENCGNINNNQNLNTNEASCLVMIMTHETTEAAIEKVTKAIYEGGYIAEQASIIRVEKL